MTLQPESLSKAIQLSVAPVFLLAGIGALMNVLSGRLARIVDTAKQLRASSDCPGPGDQCGGSGAGLDGDRLIPVQIKVCR